MSYKDDCFQSVESVQLPRMEPVAKGVYWNLYEWIIEVQLDYQPLTHLLSFLGIEEVALVIDDKIQAKFNLWHSF